jgi:CHAD domain-containing protein
VLIRRLRSGLRFLGSGKGKRVRGVGALDRALRRIAAESGPVRDADVMEAHLAELRDAPAPHEPGWPQALALLTAELVERRDVGRSGLVAALADDQTERQLARAPAVLAALGARAPRSADLACDLVGRVDELVEHVRVARAANEPDEWHRVRIAIKRVRYVIEMVDGRESPLLEGLVRMQQVLGRAHDHRVWQQHAKALRKRLPHRGLDVIARAGLAAFAAREAACAERHEQRFAEESEAVLGAEFRARVLAAFGLAGAESDPLSPGAPSAGTTAPAPGGPA